MKKTIIPVLAVVLAFAGDYLSVAQVEIVLLAELVREHDVGIPEACLTVLVAALFGQQSQHPVAISGTSAQQEGGLVLLDRAFQCHAAGEET